MFQRPGDIVEKQRMLALKRRLSLSHGLALRSLDSEDLFSTASSPCPQSPSEESVISALVANGPFLASPSRAQSSRRPGAGSASESRGESSGKSEADILLAAAHIDDAVHNRGAYGKAMALTMPEKNMWLFQVISDRRLRYLLYITIILHCFLIFGEPPSVTEAHPAVIILNAVCLMVYVIAVILNLAFLGPSTVLRDKHLLVVRIEIVIIFLYIVDFIILIAEYATEKQLLQPFRALRGLMLVLKFENVRHMFMVVTSITRQLAVMVLGSYLFVLVFSAIGVHMFNEDYHANMTKSPVEVYSESCVQDPSGEVNVYIGAFDNIGIASLRLFVLLTTENYPSIMFPAYTKNKLSFAFFGIFILLGVFVVMAVVLAIVVDAYWALFKVHLKRERKLEREQLVKAWNILLNDQEEFLDVKDERLSRLFKILKPKSTDDEIHFRLKTIARDDVITAYEWLTRTTEALTIEVVFDEPSPTDHSEVSRRSHCWLAFRKFLQRFAEKAAFEHMIMMLMLMHSMLFAVHWHGISDSVQTSIQTARTVMTTVFVVEMAIRLITSGKVMLMNDKLEMMDFSMVMLAALANFLWYGLASYRAFLACISGVAIVLRILFNSAHTEKVMAMILHAGQVFVDLLLQYGIVVYFAAVVGMEFFHRSKPCLTYEPLKIYNDNYDCGAGFETMACSLLIVFQLTTGSNWHEIMNGVVLSVGNIGPFFYFVICFMIINLVVMNLFVAVAINAFERYQQKYGKPQNDEDDDNMQGVPLRNDTQSDGSPHSPTGIPSKAVRRMRKKRRFKPKNALTFARKALARLTKSRRSAEVEMLQTVEMELPTLQVRSAAVVTRNPVASESLVEVSSWHSDEEKQEQSMARASVIKVAHVVQAFMPRSPSGLQERKLQEGEQVELTGSEEVKDGKRWLEGRIPGSSRRGLFPAACVVTITNRSPAQAMVDASLSEVPTLPNQVLVETERSEQSLAKERTRSVSLSTRHSSIASTSASVSCDEPLSTNPQKDSAVSAADTSIPKPTLKRKGAPPPIEIAAGPMSPESQPMSGGNLLSPAGASSGSLTPGGKVVRKGMAWRHDMVDMTEMNPNELKELNKMLKERSRIVDKRSAMPKKNSFLAPSGSGSVDLLASRSVSTIAEDEEGGDEVSHPTTSLPSAKARSTELRLKQQTKYRREQRSKRLKKQLIESSSTTEEENKRVSQEQESLANRVDDLAGWLEERTRQPSPVMAAEGAEQVQQNMEGALLPNQVDCDDSEPSDSIQINVPVVAAAEPVPSSMPADTSAGCESPSLARGQLLRSPALLEETLIDRDPKGAWPAGSAPPKITVCDVPSAPINRDDTNHTREPHHLDAANARPRRRLGSKPGADMPDWLRKLVEVKGGKVQTTDDDEVTYDEEFDPEEKQAPPSFVAAKS